ncbi:MAG: hypothetical protein GY832_18855 [Chloroflexi bacterium]|nr:hypothetical protein [Chloroflexota bacterium]
MNNLPIQALLILLGIGIVALLWLAMRFGRTIGMVVLGLGLLVVAILGAAALATQAGANLQTATAAKEAVEAVKVASVGQSITFVLVALGVGLAVGGMGVVTLSALGVTGWFAVRYQLAQRDNLRIDGNPRRRLSESAQAGQIFYVTDDVDDGVDLSNLDLQEWGW